ncbi:MAG: FCD domain-containing protein, partial [Devosia sp.]
AQNAAAKADDRASFHAHDLAFHDLLFDAMEFDRVKAVMNSARAILDRARRLILDPRRLTKSLSEHKIIVSAIVSAEPARASGAMRAHIDNVMAELLAFADDNPGVFADSEPGERTYAFG